METAQHSIVIELEYDQQEHYAVLLLNEIISQTDFKIIHYFSLFQKKNTGWS